MQVETVKIGAIDSDPANVREHDERNLDSIKASLRRFGQQKPIVVNSKGVVIAGNGTLQAAKMLEWDEINIVRTELDNQEATAYAIADNRTAELAEWNYLDLGKILGELPDDLLASTGFADYDLENLTSAFESSGQEINLEDFEGDKDHSLMTLRFPKSCGELIDRAVKKVREDRNDPEITDVEAILIILEGFTN